MYMLCDNHHCNPNPSPNLKGVTQYTCSRNLYPMHVTKIVQFDWAAAFESFCYKKRTQNRVAFYLVQVTGTSFLTV